LVEDGLIAKLGGVLITVTAALAVLAAESVTFTVALPALAGAV
jgi:hypothetical protein